MVAKTFKYPGHLNVENEIVEVKMTPTYEDRLTKLFYIAEPEQVLLEKHSFCVFWFCHRYRYRDTLF